MIVKTVDEEMITFYLFILLHLFFFPHSHKKKKERNERLYAK